MVIRTLAVALCLATAGLPLAANADPSSTSLQTADAAADLQPQIAWAEAWGRAVFDAYKATSKVSDLAMDSALFTAANAVTNKCGGKYRAIVVAPPGMPTDRIAVYYIGNVPEDLGLMLGRHYRIEVTGDGRTALSVTPSSEGCLFAKPQVISEGRTSIVTTHFLTPAPSEFHVFLSLLSDEPLLVGTKSGLWQVKSGSIELLKGL
jgi:hypothetical protein